MSCCCGRGACAPPAADVAAATLIARQALRGRDVPAAGASAATLAAHAVYHSRAYRWAYTVALLASNALAIWEPPVVGVPRSALAALRAADALVLLCVCLDLFVVQRLYYAGGPSAASRAAVYGRDAAAVDSAAEGEGCGCCCGRLARLLPSRGWLRVKLAVLVLLALNLAAVVAGDAAGVRVVYLARALRPVLLVERLRHVRKLIGNIFVASPSVGNVALLVALHMLFSAVAAFVLFAGIDDRGQCIPFRATSVPTCSTYEGDDEACHNYFSDLGESLSHLFELSTTGNFPALMLPAYKCDSWAVLFFVAHMTVSVYLLLNLARAVAYTSFRDQMGGEVTLRFARIFSGLDRAFREIATPGSLAGSRTLRRSDWIVFYSTLRPRAPANSAGKLFDVFDTDARGEIDALEFRRLLVSFGRVKIGLVVEAEEDEGASLASGEGASNSSSSARKGDSDSESGSSRSSDIDVPVEILEEFIQFPLYRAGAAAPAPPRLLSQPIKPAMPLLGKLAPSYGTARSTRFVSVADLAPLEVGRGRSDSQWGALPPEVDLSPSSLASDSPVARQGQGQGQDRARRQSYAGMALAAAAHALLDDEGGTEMERSLASGGLNMSRLAPDGARVSEGVAEGGGGGEDQQQLLHEQRRALGARRRRIGSLGSSQGSGGCCRGFRYRAWLLVQRLRLAGRTLLSLPAATLSLDLGLLINSAAALSVLLLETDEPGSLADPAVVNLRIVEDVTFAIAVAGHVGKLSAWSPRLYWRMSWLNRVDSALIFGTVLGWTLSQWHGPDGKGHFMSSEVVSAFMFLRFVRLVRVLRALPAFGLTVGAFGDTLPVLWRFFVVVLAIFYAFAIVGMEAFAGLLTADNEAVRISSYGKNNLYSVNFDSLHGAFICLFTVLVQGDWPIIQEGVVAATGSKAWRGYFFLFWLASNVMALNIGVAFVIEAFSAEQEKREKLLAQAGVAPTPAASGWGVVKAVSGGLDPAAVAAVAANAAAKTAGVSSGGVEDWRQLLRQAASREAHPVDFGGLCFSRSRHHTDVYTDIYRLQLRETFADTFCPPPRTRGSESAGTLA